MSDQPIQPRPPADDDAPEALRHAFKRLAQPTLDVPASVDAAVSDAARAHLDRKRHWTSRHGPLGIAAMIALAFMLSFHWFAPSRSMTAMNRASDGGGASGGADGAGADILPAFALARDLDSGAQPAAAWDRNGDGVVNAADVEFLAVRATTLPAKAMRRRPPAPPAPANANVSPRFATIDVFIDPHDHPLAAYQFRCSLRAGTGSIKIVGVESGDSAAFNRPPFFDHKAVEQGDTEQVVVAMFSTAKPDVLPSGKTRVATIHVLIEGGEPKYDLQLEVAADAGGQKISAESSHQEGAAP